MCRRRSSGSRRLLGLVGASVLIGQVMVLVPLYRFRGTAGIAVMRLGLWLLSQVTTSTSKLEMARDIVLVGAGLGATFPCTCRPP